MITSYISKKWHFKNFQLLWLFCCSSALAKQSCTILNRNKDTEHLCLTPNFGREGIYYLPIKSSGFPGNSAVKEFTCNAGDMGSTPGSGSFPGEGNGNPLRYSCLENPMDREVWWTTVHGVARIRHDLATKQQQKLSG